MHLTRCHQQKSKSLDEFYSELSQSNEPVTREAGKAMLSLMTRLRALSDERHVYGLTSHYRLCLLAQDLADTPWFVIVAALDAVFDIGWEHTFVRIRPRKERNILQTDDHFLCVTEGLLRVLEKADVKGFEHKPLPESGWYVLRITNRRKFDPEIYRTPEPACAICKRQGHYGILRFEREIELPKEKLTFFSTDKPRGQGGYDIFVTDKLRELLVESGAKGGGLHRLLTDAEEKLQKENPKWKPKNFLVSLGQHRNTITD